MSAEDPSKSSSADLPRSSALFDHQRKIEKLAEDRGRSVEDQKEGIFRSSFHSRNAVFVEDRKMFLFKKL